MKLWFEGHRKSLLPLLHENPDVRDKNSNPHTMAATMAWLQRGVLPVTRTGVLQHAMTGHRLWSFCGGRVLLLFTNRCGCCDPLQTHKDTKQRDQDFEYPRSGHMMSRIGVLRPAHCFLKSDRYLAGEYSGPVFMYHKRVFHPIHPSHTGLLDSFSRRSEIECI